MFYKKKPVTIEAIQYDGTNSQKIVDWSNNEAELATDNGEPCMFISTLDGVMIANINDYIIKGADRKFYPCKPDIFVETYIICIDNQLVEDTKRWCAEHIKHIKVSTHSPYVVDDNETWSKLYCPICHKELDFFHSECNFDDKTCKYCGVSLERSNYQRAYDLQCELCELQHKYDLLEESKEQN